MKVYRKALSAAICLAVLSPVQAARLTWAPPKLVNPITIQITNTNHRLRLDTHKDYRLQMPDAPLTADGGLVISGGHNIVLIGGEIRFDTPVSNPTKHYNHRRGLYIKRATGTVHIEGLWIHGKQQDLLEGIDIDMRAPGAVLQLENIRVDTVHGSYHTNHADCLQIWGGPNILRVDHFTGFTNYQAFFFQPQQFQKVKPTLYDLRHVDLHHDPATSGYLYWQMRPFPLKTEDVWADSARHWPDQVLWPKGDPIWKGVRKGSPPSGEFVVPSRGDAGIGYVSPGYITPASEQAAGNTQRLPKKPLDNS